MTDKNIKKTINVFDALSCDSGNINNNCFDAKTAKHIHNQAKVEELIQNAIYFYWNGGDVKKIENCYFKGITLRGNLDAVERSFENAIALAPDRLDLRFDEASTEILEGKSEEAICRYENILKMDPENFNASILYAVYKKLGGNSEAYRTTIEHLRKLFPDKTNQYVDAINLADEILHTELLTEPKKFFIGKHAIVILGYALNADGSLSQTLQERLKLALKLFTLNPESTIIPSGGMAREGITESYAMKSWLIEHGVPKDKIFIECNSKDTVGNGVYSVKIMKELKIENATIISSASHMRRALSIFIEETKIEGIKINFNNLVYLDYPSVKTAQIITQNEELVIFRDLLRTCGIWAYPGIQQ